MTGKRLALIIGVSQFSDKKISQLQSPVNDVEGLSSVLQDQKIGSFETTKLINQNDGTIKKAIEGFLKDKTPEDLLLLYFSGHGILDSNQNLFLAANNSEYDYLDSTAIPAEFITKLMNQSRSKRQVLILDCCYSGAFTRGIKSNNINSKKTFEGNKDGRVILTATDALNFAWEGKGKDKTKQSLFTEHLISGIKSGEADLNIDGEIDIYELHEYISNRITKEDSSQKPQLWAYQYEGKIIIAKSSRPEKIKQLIDETNLMVEASQWSLAASLLDEIEKLAPRHAETPSIRIIVQKGIKAEEQYGQAYKAFTQKDLETSRKILIKILDDLNPKHIKAGSLLFDVNNQLAESLANNIEMNIKKGNWSKAKAHFRKFELYFPEHSGVDIFKATFNDKRKAYLSYWLRWIITGGLLLVATWSMYKFTILNPSTSPIIISENLTASTDAQGNNTQSASTAINTKATQTTKPPTSSPITLLNASLLWQRGTGEASTVRWSPDGTIFAIGTSNGVKIYDSSTNSEIQRINNDKSSSTIAFNSDGSILGVASNRTNEIYLFNPQNGELLNILKGFPKDLANSPGQITFSNDGKYVAASMQYSSVIIWNVESGEKIKEFSGLNNWVIGSGAPIKFNPNGTSFAYVAGDGTRLIIRSIQDWSILKQVTFEERIFDIGYDPKGKWLAAGGESFSLHILNADNGSEIRSNPTVSNIFAIGVSPDGKSIAVSGYGGQMEIWNTSTWDSKRMQQDENIISVNSLSFSPNSSKLLSSNGDGTVRIWDVDSLSEDKSIEFDKVGGLSLAFSSTNNEVATFSSGSTIRIWKADTGQEIEKIFDDTTRPVTRMDMSYDGLLLALGTWEWNQALIWDVTKKEELANIPYQDVDKFDVAYNSVLRVKFSPDKKWLAVSGSQGTVILWDIKNKKIHWKKRLSSNDIHSLVFSPTGDWLAVGGDSVKILDTITGNTLITSFEGSNPTDLAFSPNGDYLAIPGSGTVTIVSSTTGKFVRKISVGEYPFSDAWVNGIAFRSDGKYFATASSNGTVCIWEVSTGKSAFCLPSFTRAAWDVKFNADGSLLGATSESGIFQVWKITDQ